MKKLEQIGSNAIFALLCLMTVLLFFEEQVEIPYWLQPMGRMHPLLLHLPIGFIVLLVLGNLLQKQIDTASFEKVNKFLLLLTALTTVIAAVMRLFLSLEEGYSSDLVNIHKWLGAGTAYLMYVLVLSYGNKILYNTLLYTSFLGVILAGHYGASLTHGEDFLTEPLQAEEVVVLDKNEPVFTSLIQPILASKCKSCHNEGKHKGDLDMSTLKKMLKGGEHGPLWEAGDIARSALIQRAVLPLDNKKHMPPKGKPQLTNDELELLKNWVKYGADTKSTIADLAEEDALKLTIGQYTDKMQLAEETTYDFDFASKELVTSLNAPYRSIKQKSVTSPALEVTIVGRHTFDEKSFQELMQIKEQIVTLNMAYNPADDEIFEVITQLKNLETLNLNFTNITGNKLHLLNQCQQLKSISLVGTAITEQQVLMLKDLPHLQKLFLWDTPIADAKVIELQTTLGIEDVQKGVQEKQDELLSLTPPVLEGAKNILSIGEKIVLSHKLNGVEIRYTNDGTHPDSSSTLYQAALDFKEEVTIKAIAIKDGWKSSEVAAFTFREKGYIPQNIELLYAAQTPWRGKGIRCLTDGEQGKIGELPYVSWLGFRDVPFVALADLGENPIALDSIGISYGISHWRKCAPPDWIEIYGGNSEDDLTLLNNKKVGFGDSKINNVAILDYLRIKGGKFRYYKIVVHPIEKFPEWHTHKGKKGSVFIDQLFFHSKEISQLSLNR
ncbi:MAG: chitobiase/beta-hexosaminidase C-terminal domain-containing protein [Bacteroidota bacterium]